MDRLDPRRFGFGCGLAAMVFYLGCAVVMLAVPREIAVRFFNSLTHGVDWGPVIRGDTPWWETALGAIAIFVLGWLFGALIAVAYNLGGPAARDSARLQTETDVIDSTACS